MLARTFLLITALPALPATPRGQEVGSVLDQQEINDALGGFGGDLDDVDRFGSSVCLLGDVDGDGTLELAVGAYSDDDGGTNTGAVWILSLFADGSVRAWSKLSATSGGLVGPLDPNDEFGRSVVPLGDLDGDGVPDLAVGAGFDDDGGNDRGALWILFLNANGSVKSEAKISATAGGFAGQLADSDYFGRAATALGDVDGDGVVDLAVGAPFHDELPPLDGGAVWVLFLRTDGSVKAFQKIGTTAGGFGGALDFFDYFGCALAGLGDQDGDGVPDLAVGAQGDDDGGTDLGAAWLLFLNANGSVKSHAKISATAGGFTGTLETLDRFGFALARMGDVDGDGNGDLAVGAPADDDGGQDRGAAWILFLAPDGSVLGEQKLSATSGNFSGPLQDGDSFGRALTSPGDLDGDEKLDLIAGAPYDDELGANHGALWVLFLEGVAPARVQVYGSGLNPPGSLSVLGGLPRLGGAVTLGLDNPLGTQAAGATTFLFLSTASAPGFPAGLPLPGFGMGGPGQPGELLLDISAGVLFAFLNGAPWSGPGAPTPIAIDVPQDSALLGITLYTQGLLLDPTSAFGVRFGLTDAAALRIGG